jgi:hypothetical protein
MSGRVDLVIDSKGIEAAIEMVMKLGNFSDIEVAAAVAFGVDDRGDVYFAMRAALDVNFSVVPFEIEASALVQINTSSLDYTTLHGDVIKAKTYFHMALDGVMHLIAFDIEFKGEVIVREDFFSLSFDGKLNFFNALVINIDGYIDSKGNFEFGGRAELDIYLGPLHLNAGLELRPRLWQRKPPSWASRSAVASSGAGALHLTLLTKRAVRFTCTWVITTYVTAVTFTKISPLKPSTSPVKAAIPLCAR